MGFRENLKKIVRPIYDVKVLRWVIDLLIKVILNNTLMRRIFTRNFSSGCLAIGEQNKYCVGPSWITLDIDNADFNYDIRHKKPFPFQNESMSIIYTSHMVEHIDDDKCEFLFRESYRLLKKGGVLRVEAPDTEKIVSAYKARDEDFFIDMLNKNELYEYGKTLQLHDIFVGLLSCYIEGNKHVHVKISKKLVNEYVETMSPSVFAKWCISYQSQNQIQSGGHINPIYYKKLKIYLNKCGFKKIERLDSGKSLSTIMLKKLPGIERGHRGYFSVVLEAQK